MQHCGFAMDQGVRATLETSFVTGHLEKILVSGVKWKSIKGIRTNLPDLVADQILQ